jgi:hypothetical protein
LVQRWFDPFRREGVSAAIEFRDPQRRSIALRKDGPDTEEDPVDLGQDGSVPSTNPGSAGGMKGSSGGTSDKGSPPEYTASTRTSSGKVDVIMEVGDRQFGCAVGARILEDKLQGIAGHELAKALWGYWHAKIVEGDGYLGCTSPHDRILLSPRKQVDIDRANKARTLAATPEAPPKLVKAASLKADSLAIQLKREPFLESLAFERQLLKEKTGV